MFRTVVLIPFSSLSRFLLLVACFLLSSRVFFSHCDVFSSKGRFVDDDSPPLASPSPVVAVVAPL